MTNATPFPKYDIVLSYDAPSDEGAVAAESGDWGREIIISLPPSRLTPRHLPRLREAFLLPARRAARTGSAPHALGERSEL